MVDVLRLAAGGLQPAWKVELKESAAVQAKWVL